MYLLDISQQQTHVLQSVVEGWALGGGLLGWDPDSTTSHVALANYFISLNSLFYSVKWN